MQPRAPPPPPLRVRNIPPRYGIPIWNVHQVTLEGTGRTNNACEGWNTSFSKLIGHQHPSFWTVAGGIRPDYTLVSVQLLQHTRGQLIKKRQRRSYILYGATEAPSNPLRGLCSRTQSSGALHPPGVNFYVTPVIFICYM